MSLHGFVLRDGREQHFPLLFALMSSRQEVYVQVSDKSYLRDILNHCTVIIYTLQCDFFLKQVFNASWPLYQPGQWSIGIWWILNLVRIFFLSYMILTNSRMDSGLKQFSIILRCLECHLPSFPYGWHQGKRLSLFEAVWRKIQELGLAVTYMRREATHSYLKQLMTLQFVPAQDIPATFQQLRGRANTASLQSLVVCLERQWLQHRMFRPASWTVYRQTVRTNNDVEGICI